jgi:hypothetical protein
MHFGEQVEHRSEVAAELLIHLPAYNGAELMRHRVSCIFDLDKKLLFLGVNHTHLE